MIDIQTPVDEADLRRYVEHHYPDAGYTFDLYRDYYVGRYRRSVAAGRWPLPAPIPSQAWPVDIRRQSDDLYRVTIITKSEGTLAFALTFDGMLALRDEANLALGLTYANYAELSGRA